MEIISKTYFETISKTIRFALPMSAGMLFHMASNFIAMMMVAKFGTTELAAGALAISTNITIITVVTTFFYAIGISISHLRGQQKPNEEIGDLVKNGLWLAALMAIPSCIILWNVDNVLVLFKQDPVLINITKNYFHFAALTVIPMLINTVFSQFFTGTNRSSFTMVISIINLPLMLSLSYIFVLGNFGFSPLGLGGITCAGLIAQTLIALGVLSYLYFGKHNFKYKIFSGDFYPNWPTCKKIFLLGFPIGIQFGAELSAMAVATYFMGYFGAKVLAASQIVSQYSFLAIMIALSLSQAVSVLISEAYGARNIDLVKQYIVSTISMLTVFFFVILIIFIEFPNTLIMYFVPKGTLLDPDMVSLTIQFFAISGIILFLDGIRNLFSGALRGLHDSKTPMRINILCLWLVSLPMNYFAGFILHGGPIGLRLGFMTGFVVSVFILWARIKKKINLSALEFSTPHSQNSVISN